jgi:hypothetical protein
VFPVASELLWPLRLLVGGAGRFMGLFGMVVCYLRMLASLLGIALFMRFCGFSVRFGGFIVVGRCFMVVVFWHLCS